MSDTDTELAGTNHSLEITGAVEVIERLRNLDEAGQKTIIKKGLKVGGKIMFAAAEADAPEITGVLKAGLKISTSSKKNINTVKIGFAAKDYTGDTWYVAFVLYGHKVGSRKLGDARTEVPANNFLKRAGQKSGDAAAAATIDSWKEQIDAQVSKAG